MDRIKFYFNELYGKNGLINDFFYSLPQRNFVPKCIHTIILSSKNLSYVGYSSSKIDAGSSGFTERQALESALGEFVERIAAMPSIKSNAILQTFNDLRKKGINAYEPKDFTQFAEWQYASENFPFQRWDADDLIYWVKGRDLLSSQEIWIPTFLAYWGDIQPGGKQNYLPNNSTGCAAGKTIEDAIVSGLLERIERHAFSNFWFNQDKISPITYSAETICNSFDDEKVHSLFANKRVCIKVFDLQEFSSVETVLVFIMFKYKRKEYFTVGCASRFDKKSALLKACMEAYQGIELPIYMEGTVTWNDDFKETVEGFMSLEDHAFFYNRYINLRQEVPILKHAFDDSYTSKSLKYKYPHNEDFKFDDIRNLGIKKIYYIDITPYYLNLPYKVVNVIIPEYATLPSLFKYPFLGNIENNDGNLFLKLPHFFP